MNDQERNYFECFQSMAKYGIEFAADFAANAVAVAQFALLATIVAAIEAAGGQLLGSRGEYSAEVAQKSLAREALREWMSQLAKTARGMVYAFPGIDDIFRMPRNRNDTDLLTGARAMIDAGSTWEDQMKDYGMPNTWIADGTALANAFEDAMEEAAVAKAEKVGKGALVEDWVTQGSRARRTLLAVAGNVYEGNAEKEAAWATASHLKKGPSSPTPTP